MAEYQLTRPKLMCVCFYFLCFFLFGAEFCSLFDLWYCCHLVCRTLSSLRCQILRVWKWMKTFLPLLSAPTQSSLLLHCWITWWKYDWLSIVFIFSLLLIKVYEVLFCAKINSIKFMIQFFLSHITCAIMAFCCILLCVSFSGILFGFIQMVPWLFWS